MARNNSLPSDDSLEEFKMENCSMILKTFSNNQATWKTTRELSKIFRSKKELY